MDFASRQKNINRSSTCPICRNFFRQVTTIQGCCHQFCLNCITKRITEEGLRSCPVCNVDLGCAPLQKLRVESSWQSTMKNFSAKQKAYKECSFVQENNRYSEVSEHESSDEPVITYKDDHDDDDHTEMPFTRTLSRNEKQKYLAEGSSVNLKIPESTFEHARGKSLGKMSDLFGPPMGSENAAILCTNSHSLEQAQGQYLGAKYYGANVIASAGSRSPFTIDDKNVNRDQKVAAFWFALVASDKQKSKAPLEQIPSRYLRVRDGNITVSSIKKYLVQKLNLSSENEVDISLQGRQLRPNLQVCKLLDLWLHKTTPSETKRAFVGCSAKDFVLTLTYGRKAN